MGRRGRKLNWFAADVESERVVRPPRSVRVWSPRRRVVTLVDGEWCERSEELLPGYLLFGARRSLYESVRDMVGVSLLHKDPLPEQEVERIRKHEEVSTIDGPAGFARGEACAVRGDARSSYAGLGCTFEAVCPVNGGFFAKVEVDLYGEAVVAWVAIDHLERA